MRISSHASASHPGSREMNEDAVMELAGLSLFAIADGMGGGRAAELALETVSAHREALAERIAAVRQARTTENRLALGQALEEVFSQAARSVRHEANQTGTPELASTLLMAVVVGTFAYVAHVGDSRAYLVRRGGIVRLTEDHTVAEFRFRRGKMSRSEYLESPERHVLYQALGVGAEVDVDLAEIRLTGDDRLLLCTDGLIRSLDEEAIARLSTLESVEEVVHAMVSEAVGSGAPDNVTVTLIQTVAEPEDDPIEPLTEAMGRAVLFQGLSEPERLLVAPYLEERVLAKGDSLWEPGETVDGVTLVVTGRLRHSHGRTAVNELRPGQHIGELSLTGSDRWNSSLRATEDTRVLMLTRRRFLELTQHKPELGARIAVAVLDRLGDRLRSVHAQLESLSRGLEG